MSVWCGGGLGDRKEVESESGQCCWEAKWCWRECPLDLPINHNWEHGYPWKVIKRWKKKRPKSMHRVRRNSNHFSEREILRDIVVEREKIFNTSPTPWKGKSFSDYDDTDFIPVQTETHHLEELTRKTIQWVKSKKTWIPMPNIELAVYFLSCIYVFPQQCENSID